VVGSRPHFQHCIVAAQIVMKANAPKVLTTVAVPSLHTHAVRGAAEPGLGLKAAWTAAEQIGNVMGLSKPAGGQQPRSRSGVQQVR